MSKKQEQRTNPNAPEDCCQHKDFAVVGFRDPYRQCLVCGRIWKWTKLVSGEWELVEVV